MFSGHYEKYIIPAFQVGAWAGWSNQPNNDKIEVVSSSASDAGKITLWGLQNGSKVITYETLVMTGTTPVITSVNWDYLYGAFLGDRYGKNYIRAVGTITLREGSADQAITTIAIGKLSCGMSFFELEGNPITLAVLTGRVYKSTTQVVSALNGFEMTAPMATEEICRKNLGLVSDSSGAECQIIVWEAI